MIVNLIAFQGPSGSGKSTLQGYLDIPRILTWTSRPKRYGEIEGRDYYFTSKENMIRMFKSNELLEMTKYKDNYYGTPLSSIQTLANGYELKSIIVDFEGAKKLKELLGNKLLLIGVAATFEECKERLLYRNSSSEELEQRLLTYKLEMDSLYHCDIIIRNSGENHYKSKLIIQSLKKGLVGEDGSLR
ncbi:Guanylate kinase [compost metagenome]